METSPAPTHYSHVTEGSPVYPSQVMVAQNALVSSNTEHQAAAPTTSDDSIGILLRQLTSQHIHGCFAAARPAGPEPGADEVFAESCAADGAEAFSA